MTLTIIANIYVNEGKIDFVKNELLKLIAVTREEEGCINYDLHLNNDDPSHFMFFENWQSHEDWQKHMDTAHIKHYAEAVEGVVKRQTFQMTKIDS